MAIVSSHNLDMIMQSKATSPLLRRLVWAGIIPSHKFMQALNLTAGNSFLKHYGLLFLSLIGFTYIAAGSCALLAFAWQDIPFIIRVLILASALIISSFLATNKDNSILRIVFTCCSLLLTGGLLLISGDNFTLGKSLWPVAVLWTVLTLPWALLAKSLVVLSVWFGIVLITCCLWGVEVGMPTGIIAWPAFFSIMSVFVGCVLGVREVLISSGHCPFLKHHASRLFPLFLCLTLALVPILGYLLGFRDAALSESIIIFVLLSMLATLVYIKIFSDPFAVALIIFEFCFVLTAFCADKYISSHDNWYIIFGVIIVIFGFCSFLLQKVKYKSASKEEANNE